MPLPKLQTTLLLGVEKAPPEPACLPAGLESYFETLMEGGKEQGIWKIAAVTTAFERSAVLPIAWQGQLPTPVPELLPYCSSHANHLLEKSILQEFHAIVEFWLRICLKKGYLAHPKVLPTLLQWATSHKRYWHPDFLPVIGERGKWLASKHAKWKDLLPEAPVTDPDLATGAAFTQYLRQLRLSDPAQALALAEERWSEAPVAQKAAMLEVLSSGLALRDEVLLLRAFSDKSPRVQTEAFSLLQALPGSVLAQKTTSILQASIRISSSKILGFIAKNVLEIKLTADPYDLEFLRIETLSPVKGKSDEQHILEQLMAMTPPENWLPSLPDQPVKLNNLWLESPFSDFLPAIEKAVLRFADAPLALWLIIHWKNAAPALLSYLPEGPQRYQLAEAFLSQTEEVLKALLRAETKSYWPLPFCQRLFTHFQGKPYLISLDETSRFVWMLPSKAIDALESTASISQSLRDKINLQVTLRDQIQQSFLP